MKFWLGPLRLPIDSWRDDENRAKLGWLIRLRWLALCCQAASIFPGIRLGFLARQFLGVYAFSVAALAVWNALSVTLIYEKKRIITQYDLGVQFLADIGTITLLLSITGGIYNPFSSLLSIHAALAVLLLRGIPFYLILGLICASLGFLQWDPDISHLSITAGITRPMISLAYGVVALWIAMLIGWLLRTMNELRSKVDLLKRQRERLDRLKVAGAIAAGFSHEFATPLYSLRLRMNRIVRAAEGALQDDALAAQEALLECERVFQTLTQTGMKADQVRLEKGNASNLFKKWISEYRLQFSNIEINIEEEPAAAVVIEAPLGPLMRSFFDLLDNAREAATTHSAIHVRLYRESSFFYVVILNKGKEIPSIVLEKIGEPFVTTKPDGTGLGLFNALTLIQAMGGDLSIARIGQDETEVKFFVPIVKGESL